MDRISFLEAQEIALRANPAVNDYSEYKMAYHFYAKPENGSCGGRDVVVMKDTGEAKTFIQFILDCKATQRAV